MRQLKDLKELIKHFPQLANNPEKGWAYGQIEMYGLSKRDLKKLEHRGYARRGYLMIPKGMQVRWFLSLEKING